MLLMRFMIFLTGRYSHLQIGSMKRESVIKKVGPAANFTRMLPMSMPIGKLAILVGCMYFTRAFSITLK